MTRARHLLSDDLHRLSNLHHRKSKELDVPGFKGVVDSLPLFVMGHSLGGCIALMMAIRTVSQGRGGQKE